MYHPQQFRIYYLDKNGMPDIISLEILILSVWNVA